ncbi:MAG: GAF domain-containing protein [Anaerolineales bacterium]|nr:GAF domain-containing protein [Anaerolineales bacterium]
MPAETGDLSLKKTRIKNTSLARRLMVSVLGVSLVFVLFSTAVQLYIEYQREMSLIDAQMQGIRASYLDSLARSLWSIDEPLLQAQLDGLIRLPNIQYVEIRVGTESVYTAGERSAPGQMLIQEFPLEYVSHGQRHTLGHLELVVDLTGVYQRMRGHLLTALIMQTLLVFLLSGFILLISDRLITRPLDVIARYTHQLELDTLTQPLTLASRPLADPNDELVQVAAAVNAMRERLARSVTIRRQAEETLLESQHFIQSILNTTPDFVYIYDLAENRNIYVNREILNVLGYSPEEIRQMGDKIFEHTLHPEDAAAVFEHRRRMVTVGDDEALELDYRMKDVKGQWRWLHSRDRAFLRNDNGAVRQIVGAAVDITERKRAELLQSALYRIAEESNSAEDLPAFYAAIHRIVGELMYARNFYIALYDEATQLVSFPFLVDEVDPEIPSPQLAGKGMTAYAIRTGQPALITSEGFKELLRQGEIEIVGIPAVDWLGVPLKVGDRTLGVLAVQSYKPAVRYTEKDKDLLVFVSQHIATALERKRAQEELRHYQEHLEDLVRTRTAELTAANTQLQSEITERKQRITELSILNEISRSLSLALNLDELLETVHQQVSRTFATTNFYIATYEEGSDEWTWTFDIERGQRQPVARHKLGIGLTGYIIRSCKPALLSSRAENSAFKEEQGILAVGEPAWSWMGVPLIAASEVVGVMAIQSYEQEHLYSEQDLALFSTIGAQVAVVLKNARLFAEAQRRAVELEAANKELGAFSYSVSHDLRAPLRVMDGFSQALLEDYANVLDSQGKDYLERVRAASQRMGQLIDDMLKLSRVTRGEMRRAMVDLSALAQTIAAELRTAQPERQIEFVIAPGLVVNADPSLLRIVLENLLGNACKFTSKHPTARIEIGAAQHEGQAAYFVRDDGAGFDMAYAGKLFGAFQRLHASTEFEGTGVGLATVQRIIHRHGGRVWAEGAVDKGATFYFTLLE